MGASRGSISYTLYRTRGEFDRAQLDTALERMNEFKFRGLSPESEADVENGWCVFDDLLQTDFDAGNVFVDPYIRFGLRTDRWSLPSALVKAQIAKRLSKLAEQTKRSRPTKKEKEEVRALVVAEMKRNMLPAASAVDVVWNIEDGTVRFWTQSARKREVFEDLFQSTFDLEIKATTPYLAATSCGLDAELTGNLDGIERAIFTDLR